MQSFDSFGLSSKILKGIQEAGFTVPSPVQEAVIPHILDGRDVMAQAHTGTGKTAAFGLPLMNKLGKDEQMLIITPTRELAMQVSDELFKLGKYAGIKTAAICGGQSYTRQKMLIESGAQVVTATPGRLLDLLSGGKINSFQPKFVVLDEADEMLDMGFFEDITSIFEYLPKKRQTLLFSATIPKNVERLALSLLIDPVRVDTKGSAQATNMDIDELYFIIEEHERDDALIRLVDFYDPVKAIIFTRTKKDADRVSTSLVAKGYPAKCLHGDLSQPQREEVTRSFRNGSITLLVATDVAARGLDIQDVSHVLNYHLPFDPESYVHRVGRTGRAGNKGMAITLVVPAEYRSILRIQKVTGAAINYRNVPTLAETNDNLILNVVSKVRETPTNPFAGALIESLQGDMNMEEIAIKLASMIWESEGVSGPDKLGVYGKKLDRLRESSLDNGGGRGDGGRRRQWRGGSSRDGDNKGGSRDNRDNRDNGGRREFKGHGEGKKQVKRSGSRNWERGVNSSGNNSAKGSVRGAGKPKKAK